MAVVSYLFSLASTVQVLVGVWMFARTFPERPRLGLRVVCVLAAVALLHLGLSVASMGVGSAAGTSSLVPTSAVEGPGPVVLASSFVMSVFMLVVAFACTRFCYDTSPWNALACCAAGYTVQNIASGLLGLVGILSPAGSSQSVTWLAVAFLGTWAVVYGVSWFAVARRMELGIVAGHASQRVITIMVLVVVTVVGFDLLNKSLIAQDVALPTQVLYRLMHGVICMALLAFEYHMLYGERLRVQVEATRRLEADRDRQLELTKSALDAINARCHDIRHMVLRQLDEADASVDRQTLKTISRGVDIFDAEVKTGNETLDVILTQKSLVCEARDIALSCIADGSALSHVDAGDLYGLLDDMLNAAVEDAGALGDHDARSIALQVRRRGAMAVVHEEHPYQGRRTRATWEADARTIAERYGGTLTVTRADGLVRVNLLLPTK